MTPIYHITHIGNLPRIIADGGLWSDSECKRQGINGISIGYSHIKARRMRRRIPLEPGGVLGDYVPFYFAPRSPMLYTIERRNTEYKGGQQPVVHLVSSAEAVSISNPAVDWMFTEGHAEIEFSQFFGRLEDLDKVDWEIMQARRWADTPDDNDRLRRRQAEFLVHKFFPWQLVCAIGVYDTGVVTQVRQHLQLAQHKPAVSVHGEWYY